MKPARIITPLIQVAILTLLIIKGAFSGDVHVIGSLKHSIQPTADSSSNYNGLNNTKVIQLLKIELSDEAKKLLERRIKEIVTDHSQPSHSLLNAETPKMVQLAMNHVPVLDQGTHGTCITFAITGALDAIIGHGDYISQLCHLQLGNYLEKHGYALSGWDGNYPIAVINQIEQYGIVNKEKQTTIGCGGLTEYPTYSNKKPESYIDPQQYGTMNELIFGKIVNWSNIYWRISSAWTLAEVKEALQSGDRSVFSVMLPRIDLGVVGAVGNYKTKNDTWLITSDVLIGVPNAQAAHGMIITGYDDNAVAVDNYGKKHTGLLTLRNSWGSNWGDNGQFYMSYDYFRLLTYDVRRFSPN
ncbi:cysteine protease, papain C1 family [Legionella steigerwaltii]|uniref:Cysteine protease n=1 Tax=Legionella steigerwaltii TaxID=460 RepID=A0A378L4U9_9GAMM|nr:C1 family peptidase [Legionella steigerwaltii]KTD76078.1 cysteine protease [Legionella steigerwaltii]STY22105.1 cysteine protease, papain C1 family [Legionella steigerwaltii]